MRVSKGKQYFPFFLPLNFHRKSRGIEAKT